MTFYKEDGKTVLGTKLVVEGESVEPMSYDDVPTGYVFGSWVTSLNGEVSASFENVASDFSVYAKVGIITVTITYYDEKGALLGTTEGDYGSGFTAMSYDDVPTGYVFGSWVTSLNGAILASFENVTSDFSVYAKVVNIPATWVASNMPDVDYWGSVCYGADKFVALTWTGRMAYSTDGITWTEGEIPDLSYNFIGYLKDKFIATTSRVENSIVYSTDGINWITKENAFPTAGTYSSWQKICYGNGVFVATAPSTDVVAYSTDGINWSASTFPSSSNWFSVCYGNDKFVAFASDSKVAYSTDGINWTENTLPNSLTGSDLCYGNGKFVGLARTVNYEYKSVYSTNGIDWHESTNILPGAEYYNAWATICYGNGKYIATPSERNTIAYSIDGIDWVDVALPVTGDGIWSASCYGKDKFVALDQGYSGSGEMVYCIA